MRVRQAYRFALDPTPSQARKRGPDRRTGQRPSNRWRRADRARNAVHHRVSALRQDAVCKLTTSLAGEYGTMVVSYPPNSKLAEYVFILPVLLAMRSVGRGRTG